VVSVNTIVLASGQKVRYAGLESLAAESPWFEFCRQANAYLVQSKKVLLLKEPSLSEEGTVVAYVYTPIIFAQQTKYLFVNAELVRFGFAKALPVPQTLFHKHLWQSLWDLQEQEAKRARLLIWSKETPQ
jgi:endonuclease YncB( thermonuclease family)